MNVIALLAQISGPSSPTSGFTKQPSSSLSLVNKQQGGKSINLKKNSHWVMTLLASEKLT